MDRRYIQRSSCTWACGSPHCTRHSVRSFRGRDHGTSAADKLCSRDNPSSEHTPGDIPRRGFQSNPRDTDRLQLHSVGCIRHWRHKAMAGRDWWSLHPVQWAGIGWRDLRSGQRRKYTLLCGRRRGRWHLDHTARDRDRDTFDWYKPGSKDIQSWPHILVCNKVVFQRIPQDRCKLVSHQQHDILSWDHKAKDDKDPEAQYLDVVAQWSVDNPRMDFQ